MKAGRNRHGRKDHSGLGARTRRAPRPAAAPGRSRRAVAALALGAVPAQAETGGVGAAASEPAPSAGQGIVFSSPMRIAGATWYGPGLYGNHTACGETLRPGTDRRRPSHAALRDHGQVRLPRPLPGHQVIDRGPYTHGNAFDLTNGARRALGFEGVGQVRYAVAVSTPAR